MREHVTEMVTRHSTCDGWLAESGDGTLSITVGVYREPTDPPPTDKHIFGFALNYGQADEQLVNQINITFTDPTQHYVSVQIEPWEDEDSISLVGKWVQSSSQARRLAGRAMQRAQSANVGTPGLAFTDELAVRGLGVLH